MVGAPAAAFRIRRLAVVEFEEVDQPQLTGHYTVPIQGQLVTLPVYLVGGPQPDPAFNQAVAAQAMQQ